jgi:flavocytochrome c
MSQSNLTRRDFVKGLAVAGAVTAAGGVLAGCQKGDTVSLVPEKWDEEVDVVVIGLGGAGAAAAIEAHDAGAEVIILEKGVMAGGSTSMCGQCIYGAGTSVQKALGIEDSAEDMFNYYKAVCDGDQEIMKLLCDNSADDIEWLINLGMKVPAEIGMPGITIGGVEPLFAHVAPPVPRSHWSSSEGNLWPILLKAIEDRGIKYYLETPASKLITNGQEIVGVTATKEGKPWQIKAGKGVVIAAGGFSRNKEMLYNLVSSAELVPFTCLTDDGDGIKMAQSAGAAVAFVDGILDVPTWKNPEIPNSFLISPEYIAGQPPYIVVNLNGNRFVDETTFYEYSNPKILAQPESICFVIASGEAGKNAILTQDVKSSETIEGLAQELGIDPAGLAGTVKKWNQYCQDGQDPDCGRAKLFSPIDSGPYYGGATYPGFAATMGGIKVNTKSEVLDALSSQPVARLYAAGCGAASYGRFYPGCGSQVNQIICTGRIAGKNVAQQEG